MSLPSRATVRVRQLTAVSSVIWKDTGTLGSSERAGVRWNAWRLWFDFVISVVTADGY